MALTYKYAALKQNERNDVAKSATADSIAYVSFPPMYEYMRECFISNIYSHVFVL